MTTKLVCCLTNIPLLVLAVRPQPEHDVADLEHEVQEGREQRLRALHAPDQEVLQRQRHVRRDYTFVLIFCFLFLLLLLLLLLKIIVLFFSPHLRKSLNAYYELLKTFFAVNASVTWRVVCHLINSYSQQSYPSLTQLY